MENKTKGETMKRIAAALAAATCAACGPSQYEADLQECNKLTGSQALSCIYAADDRKERRAASALAVGKAVTAAGTVASGASTQPQQPVYAPPQIVKVSCTDNIGPNGYTTCRARQ